MMPNKDGSAVDFFSGKNIAVKDSASSCQDSGGAVLCSPTISPSAAKVSDAVDRSIVRPVASADGSRNTLADFNIGSGGEIVGTGKIGPLDPKIKNGLGKLPKIPRAQEGIFVCGNFASNFQDGEARLGNKNTSYTVIHCYSESAGAGPQGTVGNIPQNGIPGPPGDSDVLPHAFNDVENADGTISFYEPQTGGTYTFGNGTITLPAIGIKPGDDFRNKFRPPLPPDTRCNISSYINAGASVGNIADNIANYKECLKKYSADVCWYWLNPNSTLSHDYLACVTAGYPAAICEEVFGKPKVS